MQLVLIQHLLKQLEFKVQHQVFQRFLQQVVVLVILIVEILLLIQQEDLVVQAVVALEMVQDQLVIRLQEQEIHHLFHLHKVIMVEEVYIEVLLVMVEVVAVELLLQVQTVIIQVALEVLPLELVELVLL